MTFGVYSQGPAIEWQRCLGGIYGDSTQLNDSTFYYSTGEDQINKIRKTSDGGYILVGSTGSNNYDVSGNHGLTDIWVVKLSISGNIQWQKCFGGSYYDYGSDIQPTLDGGFIVCGYTESNDGDLAGTGFHGNNDIFIFKLNNFGIVQWKKCLGGNYNEISNAVKQTNDGGFIVVGETNTNNNGDVTGYSPNQWYQSDAWVVKLNSFGNIDWKKCFGDVGNDSFSSVEVLNDGSFYFSGTSDSYENFGSHGQKDFWVVKVGLFGDTQWQKLYGGSSNDFCNSMKITNDQGFILLGQTYSHNGDISSTFNITNGESDIWALRLDNTGNIIWENSFGGTLNESGSEIIQTTDGGFALTGNTNSFNGDISYNYGQKDFWIIKLNSSGNKIWQKCFGGVYDDVSNSIVETADGGFVLAGSIESNDYNGTISGYHGDGDGWVVKLGYYNQIAENNDLDFSVSPNPTSDKISIKINDDLIKQQYSLYDQFGRMILESRFEEVENEVDLREFQAGIYFLRVEGSNETIKIVKN